MDVLFIDPNDAEDRCFFPEQKSLELLGCALQLTGLLTILRTHQKTLKKLILDRVTLPPNYRELYWREIGDVPPPHQTGHVPSETFRSWPWQSSRPGADP